MDKKKHSDEDYKSAYMSLNNEQKKIFDISFKQQDRNKKNYVINKIILMREIIDILLENIAPGKYKVNQKDVVNYGPISRVAKYYKFLDKNSDIIYKSYKEQSQLTGMSIEEIKMAQGYLYSNNGRPMNI